MTAETTRPATWEDVKLVARLLEAEGARWVLIGGYAIAAHGFVRMSEDVDILVDPSPENARRWIAALSALPDGTARELVGEKTSSSAKVAMRFESTMSSPWISSQPPAATSGRSSRAIVKGARSTT